MNLENLLQEAASPQPMMALVLEPNKHDRDQLCEILTDLGYEITSSENWSSFYKQWSGVCFNLAIFEFHAYIEAGGKRDLIERGIVSASTNVIVCVSFEHIESSAELLYLEVNDVLSKPLNRAAIAMQLRIRNKQKQTMWSTSTPEQHDMFLKAFETMNVGVTISDTEGKILYVNPADALMHGYTVDELVGKNVRIFATTRHWKIPSLEQMREFSSWRRETVNRRKDNTLFPVQLTSDVVKKSDGEPIGLVTICEDITARKVAEDIKKQDTERMARLVHQTLHDPLTKLPNRTLFKDRLNYALSRIVRKEHDCFALLFMDLDNFKNINDIYGHSAGDHVLFQVAARLQSCLRPADTVARLGGDEFAILLDEIKDPSNALNVIGRIQSLIKEPYSWKDHELLTSVSIGVVLGTQQSNSADELMRQADSAMYTAKANGKAQYHIFEPLNPSDVASDSALT